MRLRTLRYTSNLCILGCFSYVVKTNLIWLLHARHAEILIEHYAGKFPLWLSPVQIKILPIADRFSEYAEKNAEELKAKGFRCEIDYRAEKIGYKIREAQLDKVPYMVIVGQKEAEKGEISVRKRDEGDLGSMSVDDFMEMLQKEMEE